MEIKINTEETKIEELKGAIDIIKRAIERRSDNSTQTTIPKKNLEEPEHQEVPQPKQLPIPENKVEPPKPIEEKRRPTPPPHVDLSAISMPDKVNKSFSKPTSMSNNYSSYSTPQKSSKEIVQEIITNMKRKSPEGPLYMQNIISLASTKGLSEDKTRQVVSQLKEEGSI